MVTRRRGHGEGSIYYRADKKHWVGNIDLGTLDGRRIRKTVTARTRAETADKLHRLQTLLNAGSPVPDERITVPNYLRRWITDVVPGSVGSVNTVDNYAWAINRHLIPGLGHKRLTKLTPSDVAAFLKAKSDAGMAKNSVARLRSVLVAALANAVLEGLVGRNVAALVRGPRGPVVEGRALTGDEAGRLLDTAKGRRLEAAFVTMLMVGLRPGEVLGLSWSDVDLDAGTVQVRQSLKRERGVLRLGDVKTRRSRRALALPRPAVEALAGHRRAQAKERLAAGPAWTDLGLVFPTSVGTLMDPSNFRREFGAVTEAAGLGHWHPHELRHSAVSLLSAAGVPLEDIADVMGHDGTRMTAGVYRHAVTPTVRGAVDAMERLFPKAPSDR